MKLFLLLLLTSIGAAIDYKTVFAKLTKLGCKECVAEGYGWSKSQSKCGGFARSSCDHDGGLDVKDVPVKEDTALTTAKENDPKWEDTSTTSQLWQIISTHNIHAFTDLLEREPEAATVRANDGRGPLFWAFEYGHPDMQRLLIKHGAQTNAKDAVGKSPMDMRVGGKQVENQDLDLDREDGIEDDDLDGYATAGIKDVGGDVTKSRSREEYQVLFNALSKEGCTSCVRMGFGWDTESKRCGGFANSQC